MFIISDIEKKTGTCDDGLKSFFKSSGTRELKTLEPDQVCGKRYGNAISAVGGDMIPHYEYHY